MSSATRPLRRYRRPQSKIDIAPDTILVDHEVAAIITEQQQWVREQHPTIEPRFLFVQRTCNIAGTEQAFLATAKLKADGTQLMFSRDDHDTLHLFDRSDRILPHGWCLPPTLQTCDKGNACLTCSVFVTDDTHQTTLQQQLDDTEQLITRTTMAFERRHGHPMPADNVWLAQRHAERDALTRLLATMRGNTGGAVQGGGCRTGPDGPVPLALDLTRHRGNRP